MRVLFSSKGLMNSVFGQNSDVDKDAGALLEIVASIKPLCKTVNKFGINLKKFLKIKVCLGK